MATRQTGHQRAMRSELKEELQELVSFACLACEKTDVHVFDDNFCRFLIKPILWVPGNSNEHPQHRFLCRNKPNYPFNHHQIQMSRVMRKATFWFPTWSDTNQAVQLQKMARGLKFRI